MHANTMEFKANGWYAELDVPQQPLLQLLLITIARDWEMNHSPAILILTGINDTCGCFTTLKVRRLPVFLVGKRVILM